MAKNIRYLFVSDSRGFSFDKYRKPADTNIDVDFIILRGATISDLLTAILTRLRRYSADDYIIIKLAAGINDLLTFVYDSEAGGRVLKRSAAGSEQVLAEIRRFKQRVLAFRPFALVSFVTIPTASFRKFQASKKLRKPILDEADLLRYQLDLDTELDEINKCLRDINAETQHGISPKHLIWHTAVRKPVKRKPGHVHQRVKSNNFSALYDGLHAKATVKRKWFVSVIKALQTEGELLRDL